MRQEEEKKNPSSFDDDEDADHDCVSLLSASAAEKTIATKENTGIELLTLPISYNGRL